MRARANRIWIAAALPALVWAAQGAIGWYIASKSCPENLQALRFGTARLVIGLITLGALGASLGALYASARTWRSFGDGEGDERSERTRFVSMVALVTCATLTLGIVMAGLPTVILNACGEGR